jgi:hypothetical protein
VDVHDGRCAQATERRLVHSGLGRHERRGSVGWCREDHRVGLDEPLFRLHPSDSTAFYVNAADGGSQAHLGSRLGQSPRRRLPVDDAERRPGNPDVGRRALIQEPGPEHLDGESKRGLPRREVERGEADEVPKRLHRTR